MESNWEEECQRGRKYCLSLILSLVLLVFRLLWIKLYAIDQHSVLTLFDSKDKFVKYIFFPKVEWLVCFLKSYYMFAIHNDCFPPVKPFPPVGPLLINLVHIWSAGTRFSWESCNLVPHMHIIHTKLHAPSSLFLV